MNHEHIDDTERPAWDGEGLPPVGCECEFQDAGAWQECEVIAHRHNAAIIECIADDGDIVYRKFTRSSRFRPIRSEEDRAIDAMLNIKLESTNAEAKVIERFARALYRAGYRKTGGE